MNFDFSGAAKAKESGSRLEAGIKDVVFNGVSFANVTSQKTGDTFKTMVLSLNVDGYGDYTQNFFEPKSDERKEGQWGPQASALDHFKISVVEILNALDSNLVGEMEKANTSTFKQLVDKVAELTKPYIGKKTSAKFIPQNNGYCSLPSFPARIDKNGGLAIATRFIGDNLTLTAAEVKRIESAKTAKPTSMASSTSAADMLNGLSDSLNSKAAVDDLPF